MTSDKLREEADSLNDQHSELLLRQAAGEIDLLNKRVEELEAKLEKFAAWMDRLSSQSQNQADTSARFPRFSEACRKDARSYAATAADIRKVLKEEVM